MASELRTAEVDRHRLYALLEALENDLRTLIDTHCRVGLDLELGSYREKVAIGMERDRDAEATGAGPLHYLDLGDEIDLLNENSELLDIELRKSLRASTPALKNAVPTRHRVMHFKPLLPDDLDRALVALNTALDAGTPLPHVRKIVTAIQNDPSWTPQLPYPEKTSRVLNNLPLPEHDETGLIGRQGDARSLTKLLLDRRFPVVTVLGPGGMGKTALALQVLHDLADNPDCGLDAILWVSLKTETLTPDGIKVLRQPIEEVADIVSDLAEPLDDEFEGSIEDLAAALAGLRVLVCIDNLETTSGEDALRLVDALPSETQFLFTSRVGIGQLERILNVGPLTPTAAADLMRRLSKGREVLSLMALSKSAAEDIVSQLNMNPLGIKWLVLSVESGQRPEAVLRHQDDLLTFCVGNVWSGLAPEVQVVAQTIGALEHAVTTQELALYLETPADDLRRTIHILQRHALVRPVAFGGGELAEAFALTDTAARYLASPDRALGNLHGLRQKQQAYFASEERRRLDERRLPLAPQTVKLTNDVDRPAALVLREALSHSRRKRDSTTALDLVRQAGEMSPAFYEVDRVKGFILSSAGSTALASEAYEAALDKCGSEVDRARVSYFYSGHLARQAMDTEAARPHAEFADSIFASVETKSLLALLDIYQGNLDEGISALEALLSECEGKPQRIVATSLMDAYRRKAEVSREDFALSPQAIRYCLKAARIGSSFFNTGVGDNRMIEVCVDCIREGLNAASQNVSNADVQLYAVDLLEIVEKHQTLFQYAPGYQSITRSARRLLESEKGSIVGTLIDLARSISAPGEGEAASDVEDMGLGSIKIFKADGNFGFISSSLGEVFFHRSSLDRPNHACLLRNGVPVAFHASPDARGLKATKVTLFPGGAPDMSALRDRRLTVQTIPRGKHFCFCVDDISGFVVFVHATSFPDPRHWRSIRVGDHLIADLQLVDDDRARAAPGSIRRPRGSGGLPR